MAVLISKQTGNFTSSSTWYLADTASFLDSETNTTLLTTSYVASAAFTPGAITVDGVAVKIASRAASPNGTVSVQLWNSTSSIQVKVTTISVSDLNASANGWYFFKFDAAVTLLAATNYQVRALTSSSTQVTLYRNSTAGNWSRFLRTNTTATPAASDQTITIGEMTGTGTSNTFTVTMDSTSSATAYGQTDVCDKSVFTYGNTAATNYYYKVAGDIDVYAGAQFVVQHGTGASTAKLEFSCGSNVQYGLLGKKASQIFMYGNYVLPTAYLASGVSAGATSMTTDVSTGWLSGDEIGIASTSRTASQCEKRSLTVDASGTTLTVAALTHAHDGDATYKAELINLTRSTKVFSTSTTLQTYINIADALFFAEYVEFYNMGSGTSGKRGMNIDVTGAFGSNQMIGCSLHDFNVASSIGIFISSATSGKLYIQNMVSYNIEQNHLSLSSTSGANHTILGWTAIRSLGGIIFDINDKDSININGMTAAGASSNGFNFTDSANFTGTLTNLISHSNGGQGFNFTSCKSPTSTKASISNLYAWKNTTYGLVISGCDNLFFDSVDTVGNVTSGVAFITSLSNNITINDLNSYSTTSFSQARGVYLVDCATINCLVENSVFASSGSVSSYHSTGDVDFSSSTQHRDIRFNNCQMNSTTQFSNTSNLQVGQIGIRSGQQDGNNHYRYSKYGIQRRDTSISYEGSSSLRLTPSSASFELNSDAIKVYCVGGNTATIKVWVRKSTGSDGTPYTGNEPKLMMAMDTSMHATAGDVVCDTVTVATGVWEQLTYTTAAALANGAFTFYVTCDGTAGWINIDKWEAS